jgi:hypothetical protein
MSTSMISLRSVCPALSRFTSRDQCAQVQRVSELNGHIHPVRFRSVDGTPNVNRTVDKIPRNLQLPDLAGEVGKPFVGDRQIPAIGGVLRLQLVLALVDRECAIENGLRLRVAPCWRARSPRVSADELSAL